MADNCKTVPVDRDVSHMDSVGKYAVKASLPLNKLPSRLTVLLIPAIYPSAGMSVPYLKNPLVVIIKNWF
jgi:hypothetical protein